MDHYDVGSVDYKFKFSRDLDELQTNLVKSTSTPILD
jgi:hypothetical protein